MRLTLLEIVNEILLSMDSEPVATITDTIEAQQVAKIVQSTFYTLFTTGQLPEHKEILKLVSLSDFSRPTHFVLPDDVLRVDKVWYDVETDETKPKDYREVQYLEPLDFLSLVDGRASDFIVVQDVSAGTDLRIQNNKFPEYYTSFDEKHIVMDSYMASEDDVLKASKTRVFGQRIPSWTQSDDFIPDIDANLFPVLVNEAKSMAFEQLKGYVAQKVEQHARHSRHLTQNDLHFTGRRRLWRDYSRGL